MKLEFDAVQCRQSVPRTHKWYVFILARHRRVGRRRRSVVAGRHLRVHNPCDRSRGKQTCW